MGDAVLIVFILGILLYARWRIGRLKGQVTQLRTRMAQLEARRSTHVLARRQAPPLWRD